MRPSWPLPSTPSVAPGRIGETPAMRPLCTGRREKETGGNHHGDTEARSTVGAGLESRTKGWRGKEAGAMYRQIIVREDRARRTVYRGTGFQPVRKAE